MNDEEEMMTFFLSVLGIAVAALVCFIMWFHLDGF